MVQPIENWVLRPRSDARQRSDRILRGVLHLGDCSAGGNTGIFTKNYGVAPCALLPFLSAIEQEIAQMKLNPDKTARPVLFCRRASYSACLKAVFYILG
ncbi:MAG: hypothetical protein ACJAVM_002349 [Sulfitobacter sp.]|jgi:hypothetical protein